MDSIKKVLQSTPFRLGVFLMGAVFTAIRLGGLAFPDYVTFSAVIGIAICVMFFIVIGYQELLSRLLKIEDDRSKLETGFESVNQSINQLTTSDFNNVKNSISELKKSVDNVISEPNSLRSSSISDEKLHNSLAKRYGYANDLVEIECVIDKDGSSRVERRVTVRAFAQYDEIDTYLMVPQMLNAKGEKIPRVIEAHSIDEGRNVTVKKIDVKLGRATAILQFFPPLTDGVVTNYTLVERTPPMTYELEWTEQRLLERKKMNDPDEYFGWNINRPTRHLSIKIIFPESFLPVNEISQVRFATAIGLPSIQLQTEEQNRLQIPKLKSVSGGRKMLHFEKQYPMTNLIYMLRWQPQIVKAAGS